MFKNLKKLFVLSFVLSSMHSHAQDITMRAPAYPLITHNTFFSVWSFNDQLNDESTKHWTGKKQAMQGFVKVDGKVYQFMGKYAPSFKSILPLSESHSYSAYYTENKPQGNQWTNVDFDDAGWKQGKAPFSDELKEGTKWKSHDLWYRRSFVLQQLPQGELYLDLWNDDNVEVFINGKLAYKKNGWVDEAQKIKIPKEVVASLKKGKNVLAIHIENTAGGAMLDAGISEAVPTSSPILKAKQNSVKMNATQTLYDFTCGGVDLGLTFTSPLLLKDLDLLSRPISYVSFTVKSNDAKVHQVELMNAVSSDLSVNTSNQLVKATHENANNLQMLKVGTEAQEILKNHGDDRRIDWGYLYTAADQKDNATQFISTAENAVDAFRNKHYQDVNGNQRLSLNTVYALGKVGNKPVEKVMLLGYEQQYSMQYFGQNLRPYWNRSGNKTFAEELEKADQDYKSVLDKCASVNQEIYSQAKKSGNEDYAKLCILAYRQSIAAHELVESPNGELLFLSKENYSGGFANTVDVTYPSAPLFLLYNTDVMKGMLNGIFYYSEKSGKWSKPYPAHDLGDYPLVNGQTYGEDMPVEEAGNLMILVAAIAHEDKNAKYAEKHWETLTTWAEYLLKNGFDPANQLCTDDFAGHLARNANLSIKAIVALGAYADLAKQLGKNDIAQTYRDSAKAMAQRWEQVANDGDHYVLAFGAKNTWSQKYNMVWDKILNYNLFDKSVYEKEWSYYRTKFNKYGLPLDSRKSYTKSDWEIWTGTLSEEQKYFDLITDHIYKAYNESPSRIPMNDWYETTDASKVGFQARSVVGGYFIKILADKK